MPKKPTETTIPLLTSGNVVLFLQLMDKRVSTLESQMKILMGCLNRVQKILESEK